ncbi:uncharacterized protein LOC125669761 isoform X2 [Ostrea edulis]|uniref:uncharacterized protein LOC125669761 isoform X2 n=1 Tax=Ostrea edulis TaxID=37623 RepID=UPI0024AEF27F|nr:uncharacterized protein LOC125669761 isoform X2 [Ostrea edulis]
MSVGNLKFAKMPTQVKLSQMVDLALGTPEVGAVNFNVLHSLLHAMLKRLNILDVQADINEFDRDFLSSSKQRQISSLSDIDSGRGEDSEDALSEKSTSIKSRKTPYHHLEVKVAKMSEQLEKFGDELPTYKELFERGNMDPTSNTPVADVWKYIKIQKKVDANSDGLDELHNLVDGLMKSIKKLEQENKRLNDKISGLNIDDLMKRMAELEKKTDEMNEKFSLLPTPEELAQFVTWPVLEDALLGIKRDWENIQPQERVVVEISSQTDPPSRPVSSRPLSRVSTASSGPSAEVLDVLEKLGKLSESHDALTKRVEVLEAEIKNKLDKDALENLNLSGDLMERLSKLKEDLDALAQAREKKSLLDLQKRKSSGSFTKLDAHELQNIAIDSISHRVSSLEDKLNMFQHMVMDNSSYPSNASDFTERVEQPKNLPHSLADLYDMSDSFQKVDSEGSSADDEEGNAGDIARQADSSDKGKHMGSSEKDKSWKDSGKEQNSKSPKKERAGDSKARSPKKERPESSKERSPKKERPEDSKERSPKKERHGESKERSPKKERSEDSKERSPKKERSEDSKERSPKKERSEDSKERSPKKERPEDSKARSPKKERPEDSKERNLEFEQDVMAVFEGEHTENVSMDGLPEEQALTNVDLQIANSMLKNLAMVLNNQLGQVRSKIFSLDNELKRTAKGVEFAMLKAKVTGVNELDSDALSRAQQAILQLQAEVEKLHGTTKDIIEENNNQAQQIQGLVQHCDKLQETKADKEYVQMEVDVKADKKSLDNKVNHSLFDSTTNEINKLIKDILDKLAGHEESWNSAIKKFADDLDGKLDRLELDPLKEWLESRLKALNDKLRRQQTQVEWTEDDAAGIRKQLIQRFHCISCDRPVDLVPTGPVPSLPTNNGLPPTRSPRPYTTFELDQIRQHAKRGSRNTINFERALAEKQLARMRKSDLKALLVHFGQDIEAYREQREEAAHAAFANGGEVTDYYATSRSCGGSHTTTYPNKRVTRLSHLSHLFREEDGNVFPIYKEEVDVQGADGHIYKGRMGAKIEARLPTVMQTQDYKDMPQAYILERSRSPVPVSVSHRKTTISPPPGHRVVHPHRPTSARASPRRSGSRSDSRPQSAHPQNSRVDNVEESSHTTPVPDESAEQQPIEVPIQGDA